MQYFNQLELTGKGIMRHLQMMPFETSEPTLEIRMFTTLAAMSEMVLCFKTLPVFPLRL